MVRILSRFSHEPGSLTPPGTISRRVNPLTAERLDDLLTGLPQADPIPRQRRVDLRHAEQVTLRRIAVQCRSKSGAVR